MFAGIASRLALALALTLSIALGAGAQTRINLNQIQQQGTNTVIGNATAGTANLTALSVGGCSSASSALIWTTNIGFGCNTSITAAAVPVGGISGLGTGVATALGVNVGTAGSPVVNGGALGTPSTGTLTNATGLPAGGTTFAATQRLLGRNTAGAGAGEEITVTQVLNWLGSTRGSIPYQSGAAWGALAPGSTKFPLISNGVGADPSYGNLSLAAADNVVTGTLAIANGGTGNATGTATVNANLTGPITSSGNATAIASQTGTGTKFVVDTSPVLVTPNIGVATATSVTFGGSVLNTYIESGSWTPSPTNLTVVGTPTYTGKYTVIGNLVFLSLRIGSTVTTASTLGTTSWSGLPYAAAFPAAIPAIVDAGSFTTLGPGLISGSTLYTPTWAPNADTVVTGSYLK